MKFSIKVPATSANLGPGFDALGLALDLWNEIVVSTDSVTDSHMETDKSVKRTIVSIQGEGAGMLPSSEKNMLVRTAQKLADQVGKSLPLFQAQCKNSIPLSSGMGSSAATIVAGLLIGNTLLGNPLSQEALLKLASEMEGHPDNVAPALLGGLVVSTVNNGKVIARKVPVGMDVRVTLALPDFYLPTKQSRAALPKKVSMKNAVHNISRAVLVTEAFRSGDLSLLGEAMTDKLHQPYRLKLIKGGESVMEAAKKAGAAAVAISGAGPSVIAFSSKAETGIGESMKRAFEEAGVEARIFNLCVSSQGAEIQV